MQNSLLWQLRYRSVVGVGRVEIYTRFRQPFGMGHLKSILSTPLLFFQTFKMRYRTIGVHLKILTYTLNPYLGVRGKTPAMSKEYLRLPHENHSAKRVSQIFFV